MEDGFQILSRILFSGGRPSSTRGKCGKRVATPTTKARSHDSTLPSQCRSNQLRTDSAAFSFQATTIAVLTSYKMLCQKRRFAKIKTMKSLSKHLIIIRGPVGAGKTSVVEELRKAIGNVSIIDFDAFKRQIDNSQSSEWRRQVALDTALYLCQKLMDEGRTIVVDIHASYPEQLNAYVELSRKNGYKEISYLLYPPIEHCIERANRRIVPDIEYAIDEAMINKYWSEVFFVEDEPVYDDPSMTAKDISSAIINSLK